MTEVDLAAHRVLAPTLTYLLSELPVVSEEDPESLVHRQPNGRCWFIDPLDRTREFIARNGEFTVNIALIEEGRSVLRVVYAPSIDALYWGGASLEAYRCIGDQTVAIQVTESDTESLYRVVASKSHVNEATQSLIDRLGEESLVQSGGSHKSYCVAEGAASIYPRSELTCEWVTAAAQFVLEGAGGVVVDPQGKQLQYGKSDVLNPFFIAARDTELIPV